MGLFSDAAPKFWQAGYSAHPVKGKRAFIDGWNLLADRLPTKEEQDRWLDQYHDFNVGLVLGKQSGLIVLDIDTDDKDIQNIILEQLPKSPWCRTGRKGMMLAYRYIGPEQRTARIRDKDGNMLVEVLAARTNIVVPPSIHPDTGKRYKENQPLYKVARNTLPILDPDIDKKIVAALNKAGYHTGQAGNIRVADYVPAGARDIALVSHCGILSRSILRGERTYLEALEEITHWVKNFTQKVIGDELSEEKARMKLNEFFLRDATRTGKGLPVGWDNGLTEEDKKKLGFDFHNLEQWTATEIISYFTNKAEEILDPKDPKIVEIVESTMAHMARSEDISEIEREQILKLMHEHTGKVFSMGALRKQLKLMCQNSLTGESHTEISDALYDRISEYTNLRFCNQRFYRWNGAYWEDYQKYKLHQIIQEDFGDLPAARKQSDHSGIINCLAMKVSEDLDQTDRVGLNFANGFLTDDLELLPHDPDLGMTYVLPYCYEADKAGNCPQFFQFLEDAWGQDHDYQEKVRCLREIIAVTMMGQATTYQKAFCLFGASHSGKSQVLNIVRSLLPQNTVSNVRPETFGEKFEIVDLVGSLMNCSGEISENRLIPGDRFKLIVEGAQIQMQYKGKDTFNYAPKAAHWFLGNYLPKSKDLSEGFTRRWVFLHFDKQVPKDRKVVNLAEEIVACEREAIAAWAVQVMPELKLQGEFTLPSSHYMLREEMSNQNNPVRNFLTKPEIVRVGRNAHHGKQKNSVSEADLYSAFFSFHLATEGGRPFGKDRFKKVMEGLKTELDFEIETRVDKNTGIPKMEYRWISLLG